MAEINATFTTKDIIQDRAATAFGLNQKSVFDIVRREDYRTEAEYIQALSDTSKAMETPEYHRAARKAAEEKQRRNEAAIREAQRREFAEIRRGVKLTPMEQEQIDKQAADMARADLASGKIFASGLGARIEEYAERLADKAKDSKASSMQFNNFIRQEMNHGKEER